MNDDIFDWMIAGGLIGIHSTPISEFMPPVHTSLSMKRAQKINAISITMCGKLR